MKQMKVNTENFSLLCDFLYKTSNSVTRKTDEVIKESNNMSTGQLSHTQSNACFSRVCKFIWMSECNKCALVVIDSIMGETMSALDQHVLRFMRIVNEFKMSRPGSSCKLVRFRFGIVMGSEYFRSKSTFTWMLTWPLNVLNDEGLFFSLSHALVYQHGFDNGRSGPDGPR